MDGSEYADEVARRLCQGGEQLRDIRELVEIFSPQALFEMNQRSVYRHNVVFVDA